MESIYIWDNDAKTLVLIISAFIGIFGAVFISRILLRRALKLGENAMSYGVRWQNVRFNRMPMWMRRMYAMITGFIFSFAFSCAIFGFIMNYFETDIIKIDSNYRYKARTVFLWDSEYGFVSTGVKIIDNQSGTPLKLCTLIAPTPDKTDEVSATLLFDIPVGITQSKIFPNYICHDAEFISKHYTNFHIENTDSIPVYCLLTPAIFNSLPIPIRLTPPTYEYFMN